MSQGYAEIVRSVMVYGNHVAPRGQMTHELCDAIIRIENPYDSLPVGTGRKLNLKIAAVEALQLIGAFSKPSLNVLASRKFSEFQEPDGSFYGSYGVRIGHQVGQVIRKIKEDPFTRQAVITLWNPSLDNDPGHKDYPCTVMLGFRVRRDHLDMSVTMRSNDVWLGLTYDVFQFTQLQFVVARALDIGIGTYTHHALSLHLYSRDMDDAEMLHPSLNGPLVVDGIGNHGDSIQTIMGRSWLIADGMPVLTPTWAEQWYADRILECTGKQIDEPS
jgi:thymidylate synthase